MKYRRMTYTDRLIIEKLYNSGKSYRAMSAVLGFSPSSIHREVQRGLYDHLDGDTYKFVRRYSATIAHEDALFQASAKGSVIKLGNNYAYANMVSERIINGESPDSIVGRLKLQNQWTVSTPTLYRYIDQGFIPGISNKNLRVKSKKKKRRYSRVLASHAPKGKSIERRPAIINDRSEFGHWEMDTVISKGKKKALLVLTERKTRNELIAKLPDKSTRSVVSALHHLTQSLPSQAVKTITVDNGSEFQDYEGIKQYTQEVYYCHPYSSFERGSNENANAIIRRFLPKGTDFTPLTDKDVDAIAHHMNGMHRKILGYHSAAELFAAELDLIEKAAKSTCEAS